MALDNSTGLDLGDDELNQIAQIALQRKRMLQPLYEAQNQGPGIGQTLADLAVGIGNSLAGGNGAQAVQSQQAARAAQNANMLKALESQDIAPTLLKLAETRRKDRAAQQQQSNFEKSLQAAADRQERSLAAQQKLYSAKEEQKQANKSEAEPKTNQYQAAGFAQRVEGAEQVFDNLKNSGYDPTTIGQALQRKLPEVAQSEPLKQQMQAERNFVNSVLRRESGAAISPTEFSSAEKQYFPRPGDTEAVLEQKRQNRLQKLAELKSEAGPAYDKVKGVFSNISGPMSGGQSAVSNPQNAQALEWLKSNPNHPQAAAIRDRLKGLGVL